MSPLQFESLLARAFPESPREQQNGAPGRWSLCTPQGIEITSRCDGDWATLERPAPRVDEAQDLARQSVWPATLKCLEAKPSPLLHAEIPLLADTAAERDWSVRQLQVARADLLATVPRASLIHEASEPEGRTASLDDVVSILSGTGWTTNGRSDGTYRVDMQVRGTPRSLLLRPEATGVHIESALDTGLALHASELCRDAASVLLTHANAMLRWARGFVREDHGTLRAAGFELFVAAPVHASALILAVDTLAAACEAFAEEVELLLEHSSLAALYLERGGITHKRGTLHIDAAALRAAPFYPAAQAALA